MHKALAAWALAPLVLMGCGGDGEPEADTTPPGILSTNPASDQTGVSAEIDIIIQFDEAIDNHSINDTIFHLSLNSQSLFGQVSYDLEQHRATLSMMITLQAGATYEAVLEPGVKDMQGNRRTEIYRWSFTVAG